MHEKKNCRIFDRSAYREKIEAVKDSKGKIKNKTPEDYQRLKRYDIKKINDTDYLIHPNTNTLYVCLDEIFDIIHSTHVELEHAGREGMWRELKKKYRNITVEQVTIYLTLCTICQEKTNIPKKNLVVKPMVFDELNSRCQVDLIDMQSSPDREYKFIFVYQDHLTKFIQLRPLTSKTATEVAHVLLDVFTIIGAPCVLQSDNGEILMFTINNNKSLFYIYVTIFMHKLETFIFVLPFYSKKMNFLKICHYIFPNFVFL